MDDYQRTTLRAACIQAAATLIGPRASTAAQATAPPPFGGRGGSAAAGEPDTAACARYARDLYYKLTGETWEEPR